MGIDLRGGDVGMAKHFLYGAQVLGRLQQVAGERMTQHVRMQILPQLAFAGGLDAELDRPRAQAPSLLADEYRIVGWLA